MNKIIFMVIITLQARNINVTSEDHRYRIAFDINLGCAVINKLECIMERDMHTWEAVPKDVITDREYRHTHRNMYSQTSFIRTAWCPFKCVRIVKHSDTESL